ncbi:hypothetical protein GCM10009718_08940 [Isoptericola halotolerans]|uniref:DUF4178 domain-containing protein n=1 Tax=Isoptericola halotolerans TaxID=300560 RepID=A0ABX2A2P9_9MICO|nr:hypothetical protein [Isoptericola halotolerans]NOV96183.1 hypothetical protein [Isoptericola halotolerans]
MSETGAQDGSPTGADRFAVISRRVIFFSGYVIIPLGAWAIVSGRVALGITIIAAFFVVVVARVVWMARRGARALAERREVAEVADVAVATPGAPSSVDRVVGELLALNSDGLPYLLEAQRGADGRVRLEVRWKSEEMRWQTLFVKGKVAYAWRMEVDLDPVRSRYTFVEYSGTADSRTVVGPGGASSRASWTWHRGKTAGRLNMTIAEGADGQVHVASSGETRTSWEGAVSIRPSDAKVPVLTLLRNHGWRPRFDWFGARLFEK